MKESLRIPKTDIPAKIYWYLTLIVISMYLLLYAIIGLPSVIAIVVILLILAFTTRFYTQNVPSFHAVILMDELTGSMRVLFQGFNLKLAWESIVKIESNDNSETVNLRHEIIKEASETYASKDAQMKVAFIFSIKVDISSRFDTPSRNVIRYASFPEDVKRERAYAIFTQILSDYYGEHCGSDLLKKGEIEAKLFGDNKPAEKIDEFQKIHGCEVRFKLIDSDFSEAAQKFRDSMSAVDTLTEGIKKFTETGTSQTSAEKFVKLINFPNYTEQDVNLNVDAPDLKNLRDLTLMGNPLKKSDSKNKGEGGKK